jgi:hypothetical protein
MADVRPLRWTSLLCRVLVWCGLCWWANYVIANGAGNPTPPSNPTDALYNSTTVGRVILLLLLSCVPGLFYVFGVRTWLGTVIGGMGFAVVLIETLSSIANDHSSTAGAGILGVPFVALVPIVTVFVAEIWFGPRPSNNSSA